MKIRFQVVMDIWLAGKADDGYVTSHTWSPVAEDPTDFFHRCVIPRPVGW